VDPLTVAFGVAVARRRRAKGFSWRQLGTRCHVSANTVRNVERGSGSSRLDIIARVAQGLGTPLSRLIREAEKSRPRGRDAEQTDLVQRGRLRGPRGVRNA
jgi:transcriptional regulator with XRE-family HTH domain